MLCISYYRNNYAFIYNKYIIIIHIILNNSKLYNVYHCFHAMYIYIYILCLATSINISSLFIYIYIYINGKFLCNSYLHIFLWYIPPYNIHILIITQIQIYKKIIPTSFNTHNSNNYPS